MITILKIFTNIVTTIYQYIWFALLAAGSVYVFYIYLQGNTDGRNP